MKSLLYILTYWLPILSFHFNGAAERKVVAVGVGGVCLRVLILSQAPHHSTSKREGVSILFQPLHQSTSKLNQHCDSSVPTNFPYHFPIQRNKSKLSLNYSNPKNLIVRKHI